MEVSSYEDSHLHSERTPLLHQNHVVVYKRRWLMLTIFSLNSMLDGILLVGLSPLTNLISVYYEVSEVAIEWSTNMFPMVYVLFTILASYIVSKIGVKKTLILISMLHTITTIFHIKSHEPDQYWIFLFGQLPAAFAYSFTLQLAPRISSDWFPIRERASATSFTSFSFSLGNGLAFVMVTNIVRDDYGIGTGLKTLFQSQLIIAIIIMLITVVLYREKPENPPFLLTESNENNNLPFFTSLKSLVTNRNFIFMSQSYGIYFGLAKTLALLINPLLTTKFPSGHIKIIGWLGCAFLIISYISTFIFGLWLDRYSSYRGVAIMLNVSSTGAWLLFTLLFLETGEFIALFGVYIVLGLLAVPYMYIGPEHAAEMTFPVSESTSSAFITALGNLYSFVFVFSIGKMAQEGYLKASCFTIFALYVISSAFSFISKMELRRQNAGRIVSNTVSESNSSL